MDAVGGSEWFVVGSGEETARTERGIRGWVDSVVSCELLLIKSRASRGRSGRVSEPSRVGY